MKKNVLFISVSICLLFLLGIGLSYSMWNMSVSQETNNVIATTNDCFDVSLTNQNNNINLENAYPISNEKGKKLIPFTFTVKNTCDMFLSYTVSLESLKGSTLSSKFIDAMVNNEEIKRLSDYETTETVNNGSVESRILAKGSLSKDDSNDYSLRLWIDYDTTMEDLDNETKILKSKIIIKATASTWDPVSEGYNNLGDAILASEYQTSPEKAIKKIEAKNTPDFSETAPAITYTEKIDSTDKVGIIKPTKEALTSDSQMSSLSSEEYKIKLCTSKKLDENTGIYTISNCAMYDPTTLDFNNNSYYTFGEIVAFNQQTNKMYVWFGASGTSVYKITGLESTDACKHTWNGTTYDCTKYILSAMVYAISENEQDNSDKGLYLGTDDYGDTYYYRGNVTNNNLYFGGFYWQIIRINGDGSIRILYNGREKNASGIEQSINSTFYKFNEDYNNPTYGGYMYGSTGGTTLNEVYKNINSSTAKITLDKWYKENIVDKNLMDKISNNGTFCGDRTLYSGTGIGTTSYSYYASYGRYKNNTPQFTCPNIERDLYSTETSSIGNKALTYPIGLISYDELVFSGMNYDKVNKKSWTYSDYRYTTMSPSSYYAANGSALIWNQAPEGIIDFWYGVGSDFSLRPVINLKADTKISGGIGTINNPYIVE